MLFFNLQKATPETQESNPTTFCVLLQLMIMSFMMCLRAQYWGPILFVLYTTSLPDIIANHSVNHQLFADDTAPEICYLLQDSLSWHPATTIKHLSWKNYTGSPFQNILNIKLLVMNGSGPAYLSELLHVYTPSCMLCSSSDTCILKIQQYKCKIHGFCTFSSFGLHI